MIHPVKATNFFKQTVVKRILIVTAALLLLLITVSFFGLSTGSTGTGIKNLWNLLFSTEEVDPVMSSIIWNLRFPRVLMAAMVGATLSLGGLVFQALLRNPLAEPYILGISGGSAIGAIIGILLGLSRFPGVSFTAFTGSMITLLLVLFISSGSNILKKDSLLLSGVMVNAFCSAMIMFLISLTQDSRLHNIMFWLMGDLASSDIKQVGILTIIVGPCFLIIFLYSHTMNIMLTGKEMAKSMGVNIKLATIILLGVTSLMVSATVSSCGLLGFVGLVIPHILRLFLGPDHRVLVPSSILGGGAYMVFCDLLSRVIPRQGEMPAGVITAMIGAPLFVILLKKSKS